MRPEKQPHGHQSSMEPPDYCYRCKQEVGPEHWRKQIAPSARHGHSWRCGEQARTYDRRRYVEEPNEVRDRRVQRGRDYYLRTRTRYAWASYQRSDRARGFEDTLPFEQADALMQQPCHYCGDTERIGLDRVNNDLSHSAENVVPCCRDCNFILGDLPVAAKNILRPALARIRAEGALGDWIPANHRTSTSSRKAR